MRILSIETSTKNLSLALSTDARVVRYRNYPMGRIVSSALIPSIQHLLKLAGWQLEQIDGYAIALGPGSFTGLRVGVSAVKALAYAMNKPIVGISSLDILAASVKEENARVCALGDAKRGLVYGCVYEKKGKILERNTPYRLCDLETILSSVIRPSVFIGDGLLVCAERLRQSPKVLRMASEKRWRPQARYMAPLAADLFGQKAYANIDTLVPLYLHPEDCQVTRKKKR